MERLRLKNYFYVLIGCLTLLMILSQGCGYDNKEELFGCTIDEFSDVSYQNNILPILNQYCTGCHSTDDPAGGIILDVYPEVKFWADDGKLFCAINHEEECEPMPRNQPKLSDCELITIKNWIDNGAQEN